VCERVLCCPSPDARPILLCNFARRCAVFIASFILFAVPAAHAAVLAVSIQSPHLVAGQVTNVVSPIHLQATAEDKEMITGYVVYVDGQNVYRNFSPSADAWIALPLGQHSLYVKAWDAQSNFTTATYKINVTGFAPPNPPAHAHRMLNIDNSAFTADNNPDVGGDCNNGSIGGFASNSDPNTRNTPASDGSGQHFVLNSRCTYDDSLFYRKFPHDTKYATAANYLWDFWFYIPTTTKSNTIQALEFDLFHAVQMEDGVHEFMFGTQCNYIKDRLQLWLPSNGNLSWVDSSVAPCRFSPGTWHHVTYFLQRVTSVGYQEIPKSFSPSSDNNTSTRFVTVTIDGKTSYLGGVAWSTKPNWSPTIGIQHQLDSSTPDATLEEYVDAESLIWW